jgi:prepilin-type processing-associated H-X9-DG protein
LLPAIQSAREAARRAQCVNRLKQINLALITFHDVKKAFPAAVSDEVNTNYTTGAVVTPGPPPHITELSFIPYILPYMELGDLQSRFGIKTHWADAPNYQFGLTQEMTDFRCPSQPERQTTFTAQPGGNDTNEVTNLMSHYQGVMGAKASCPPPAPTSAFPGNTYTMFIDRRNNKTAPCQSSGGEANNGTMYPQSKVQLKDITDGSTHTFILGELSWDAGPQRVWMSGGGSKSALDTFIYSAKNIFWPLNTACRADANKPWKNCDAYENNDMSFGSLHPGGCHFAMADGSVQFVREEIALDVLKSLASRKSGESFEVPF